MFARMTFALLIFLPLPSLADAPLVERTEISEGRISVTLSHPDTGWDHYADGWEVFTPDGTSLGRRELAHPHVNEQPFTRSLGNVVVPEGVTELHIRVRCNVDGWADQMFILPLQ
ncbi:hypothetical protein O2N63_05650 [Aliiroseovarius sp. KMU-50]|uniref:Uncharacterized protein n=1 Tax=Aliiroseovarius salicola TaxID=3009082 RepID=A0ABT4VZ81_9RHOB|nr:hypothetical protein [Aliiroseovarius sp. KMU-50]MDA5093570.1 hypothetical protein [Aliiroseovarius sp. KMU-50]